MVVVKSSCPCLDVKNSIIAARCHMTQQCWSPGTYCSIVDSPCFGPLVPRSPSLKIARLAECFAEVVDVVVVVVVVVVVERASTAHGCRWHYGGANPKGKAITTLKELLPDALSSLQLLNLKAGRSC